MSNLKPAASIIPHAPGLAPSPNRPIATPGIAHAPGLVRPADRAPPPVHHAPGLPSFDPHAAAAHAKALLDAAVPPPIVHAPPIQHAPPLSDRPVNPMQVSAMRMVPTTDFEKIKARKTEGVQTPLGFIAPPNGTQGAPDGSDTVRVLRQQSDLPPNNRSNTLQLAFDDGNGNINPLVVGQKLTVFQSPGGVSDDIDQLTVTLGLEFDTTDIDTDATTPLIQAEVVWGQGNAFFKAIIDWKVGGTIFTVPGNYVAVSIIIPANASPRLPHARAMAGCAYGSSPPHHANRCTNTVQLELDPTVASGISDIIPIPAFAQAFTITSANTGGSWGLSPEIDVKVLQGTTLGSCIADYRYSDNRNSAQQHANAFVIPNGALNLKLKNVDGSNAAQVTVVFELSL